MTQPRIAVAGTGHWGRNWVRNFHELGELRYLVDSDPARLAEMSAKYPGVRTATRIVEALEDDGTLGVVVATPAITHADVTRTILEAGRDVLCEKPLALSVADAEPLAALAKRRNAILMVGHVLRYHPGVAEAIRLARSGKVGKINYIAAHRLGWGRIRTEENVLYSFSPHDISVILAIAGEMPLRVNAGGAAFVRPRIHDIVTTRLSFPAFEAHVFASWMHPFREQRFAIIGDRGMIVFDDLAPEKLMFHHKIVEFSEGRPFTQPSEGEPMPYDRDAEPLKCEARAFLAAMESRRPPVTDADEGLAVLRVLEAAQRSLDNEGMSITLQTTPAPRPAWQAHETAVIDEGARIGARTRIWHFCHVSSSSVIGDDCSLGQNCFVANDVVIGNNVKIQNNVSLYTGCIVEDDVFLGPSCVLTNVINPRSHVSRRHEYRKTLIRRGASIGANATIVCGTEIGRFAFVGAGAVVTKDVPAFGQMVGSPARLVAYRCQCGEKLHGPKVTPGQELSCSACGAKYLVDGAGGVHWTNDPASRG